MLLAGFELKNTSSALKLLSGRFSIKRIQYEKCMQMERLQSIFSHEIARLNKALIVKYSIKTKILRTY